MLSEKSRPVIAQTLGVVAERIPHITPEFYRSMFEARPDLLDGVDLIVGIDRFMSEARALTNFSGNAVATIVLGT